MFAVSHTERGSGAVGCRSICQALDSIIRPLLQPKDSYNPGTCKFVPFLRAVTAGISQLSCTKAGRDKSHSAALDAKPLFPCCSPSEHLSTGELTARWLPWTSLFQCWANDVTEEVSYHRAVCLFLLSWSESKHLVLTGFAEAAGYVPSCVQPNSVF